MGPINKLLSHVFTVLHFNCGKLKLGSTDELIVLVVLKCNKYLTSDFNNLPCCAESNQCPSSQFVRGIRQFSGVAKKITFHSRSRAWKRLIIINNTKVGATVTGSIIV